MTSRRTDEPALGNMAYTRLTFDLQAVFQAHNYDVNVDALRDAMPELIERFARPAKPRRRLAMDAVERFIRDRDGNDWNPGDL